MTEASVCVPPTTVTIQGLIVMITATRHYVVDSGGFLEARHIFTDGLFLRGLVDTSTFSKSDTCHSAVGCCRLLVHSCLLRVASLHHPTQQLSAEVVGLRHLDGLRDVGAGWFGVLKLEPQFSLPCCRLLSVNVVIVVQRCQSKPCLHPLGTEHFPLWDILYVEGMDALQIASVYALCHLLKIIFK